MAWTAGIVFLIVGLLQLFLSFSLDASAESAFHQIYAGVVFVGGILCMGFGAVLMSLGVSNKLTGNLIDEMVRVREELTKKSTVANAISQQASEEIGMRPPAVPSGPGFGEPVGKGKVRCTNCSRTHWGRTVICDCGMKL